MTRRFVLAGVLAWWSVAPRSSGAQSAVLTGTVVRDSVGNTIPEAEVSLPALKRATRTNYLGEFRFLAVPAGRHELVIRRVGFAPLVDTIGIADGQRIDREFLLAEQAVALDSVRVMAAERRSLPPFSQEFESRRKAGLPGTTLGNPPDLAIMRTADFIAVEYYASGATAPAQYNITGSDCGVRLLWRRSR